MAVVGPLARSVADLRLCLQIIAGPDGRDLGVSPASLEDVPARPIEDHRFAWADDFGGLPVSADTRRAMTKLADDLANAGCRIERASPQNFDFERVWKTYGELFGIMAFANSPFLVRAVVRALGRFTLKDVISRAGAQSTMANPKRYFSVLQERDRLVRSLERFLVDYDAWLCPVASTPAFPHRDMGKIHVPIEVDGKKVPGNIAGTGYTCAFNLTGNPVVTLALGVSREGLPIGVQVVGRRWGEMALLSTADALTHIAGPFCRPPGY
jgi:amidase